MGLQLIQNFCKLYETHGSLLRSQSRQRSTPAVGPETRARRGATQGWCDAADDEGSIQVVTLELVEHKSLGATLSS